MSYLSGIGYEAPRLCSCQDLPSLLVYVSSEKSGYVATQLCSCEDHHSPSKYVSQERSGYTTMQLSSDCIAAQPSSLSTCILYDSLHFACLRSHITTLFKFSFGVEGYSAVKPRTMQFEWHA